MTTRFVPRRHLAYKFAVVGGLVLLLLGVARVSERHRGIPFLKPIWDRGRGQLTYYNPRLLMVRDILDKIQHSRMSEAELVGFLGDPDPPFAARSKGTVNGSSGGDDDRFSYILGMQRATPLRERSIVLLRVYLGEDNRAEQAVLAEFEYPRGSEIISR